jgi:5-methylthioadenosine/S-adenosylhomocysteine deaminase
LDEFLIKGGVVITMDPDRRRIKNGSVVVKGDKIEAVGRTEDLVNHYSGDSVINAEGMMIVPGFVNVHHHSQSSTVKMRGIQLETTGGLYDRSMPIKANLPDKDRYYLGLTAILADIRMGVTTDADQDFGEKNIAKAMEDSGIRAIVSEYLYSVDFEETREKGYKVFAPDISEKTLKIGLKLIDDWDGKANGRITCDLSPHAPDTCTPELFEKVREIADERGKRVTTHLAQVMEEIRQIKDMYNKTPFEFLNDLNFLGPDSYVAHCIYHKPQDIAILAKTKTNVCHCALGMSIRGGTAPLIPWLDAGITVGLGLDDRPDMIKYMQATGSVAAYRAQVYGQGYRPKANKLLELATIEGAKVLALENEIGSLEVGKKADITIIDMKKPHLKPSVDPVADLIYFGNGNDVDTVIIDGRKVVENGKILTVDVEKVLEKAQVAGQNAWDSFYKK